MRTVNYLSESESESESTPVLKVTGLFVPLHFRSRERKDHRENFRSHGTFAPQERMFQELLHPWNLRSTNNFRAL